MPHTQPGHTRTGQQETDTRADQTTRGGKPVASSHPLPINAQPLRHPVRGIVGVILVALVVLFAVSAARSEAYGWGTFGRYIFDRRIAVAAGHTLAITLLAELLGIVLGVVLAVLRLSPNPILQAVSGLYLWIFRGTPVYVQLVFWGLLGSIYQSIGVGGLQINVEHLLRNAFMLAVLGLGLNEAAYMAEIVRAGIQAVPEGQTEASRVLGMSWWQSMRRVVLPQAMSIIIPPTGNNLISMLKTTSLVVAVPYAGELYGRATDISNALFEPVPLLLVAATWYLVITSLLMMVQSRIERYFAKGSSRTVTAPRRSKFSFASRKIGMQAASASAGPVPNDFSAR